MCNPFEVPPGTEQGGAPLWFPCCVTPECSSKVVIPCIKTSRKQHQFDVPKIQGQTSRVYSVKQAKVLSVRFPKEYDHINLAAKHPKLCTYFTPNFLICNFSIHISIHTSIHTSTHTYMHACIHIRKFRHGWGMRRVPSKTTKLGETLEKCLEEQATR